MGMQKSYSSREVRVGLAGRRLRWGLRLFLGAPLRDVCLFASLEKREEDMANCKLEKGWDSWAVGRRGAVSCLSCHSDDDALGGRLVRLALRSAVDEVPSTSQCKSSDLQGSPAFPIPSYCPRFNRRIHPAPSPSKHSNSQTPEIIESNASPETPGDQ